MKKSKKLIVLIVAVALIAAVGVGSTLAYLTAQTDTVTNTFTVGKYADNALNIWEHKATQQGTDGNYVAGPDEVKGNTYSDILPGATLAKDPFLRLAANSPTSYLFMKATGLGSLADQGITVTATTSNIVDTTAETLSGYWYPVTSEIAKDGKPDYNIYVYCPNGDGVPGVIAKTAADTTTKPLFTQLTASTTALTAGTLNNLVFSGCAVQVTSGVDYQTAFTSAIFNGEQTSNE